MIQDSITREDVIGLVQDGRKYRRRRGKWEKFWIALVVRIFVVAPLNAWLLMLLIGVAHHEWWPLVPTIGYWWALVLGALINALFGSPAAYGAAKKATS